MIEMNEVEEIEKYEPLYTLKNPIEFEGETVSELRLDLESLKASDIDKAEQIFNAKKYKAPVMELSKKYNIIVAHLSCDMPLEFFDKLSARDYQQIFMRVMGFLNA